MKRQGYGSIERFIAPSMNLRIDSSLHIYIDLSMPRTLVLEEELRSEELIHLYNAKPIQRPIDKAIKTLSAEATYRRPGPMSPYRADDLATRGRDFKAMKRQRDL